MTKPAYLGLSILELSKILTYDFWYVYVKPKYSEKAKMCYMDTDSFLVYIHKTDDIYKDIAEEVEIRQTIAKGKNKKVIGLMKDNQVEKS